MKNLSNKIALSLLVMAIIMFSVEISAQPKSQNNKSTKGFAAVNGLKMYYEIHGQGRPLLLLHGAYMTIEGPFRQLISQFKDRYQVIVPELQAHGRTADIDREITYEALADDMSEFLKYLKLDSVNILAYSMGSEVALQLAIRHPEKVKKIALISGSYSSEGLQPVFLPLVPQITPEMFNGSPFKIQYDSLAPKPNFPTLVEKLKRLDLKQFNWEKDYVKIKQPILLVFGDSDITTIDHIRDMFKKLGGNVAGDLQPLPAIQLAILPGTSHMGMLSKLDWIQPLADSFLTDKK